MLAIAAPTPTAMRSRSRPRRGWSVAIACEPRAGYNTGPPNQPAEPSPDLAWSQVPTLARQVGVHTQRPAVGDATVEDALGGGWDHELEGSEPESEHEGPAVGVRAQVSALHARARVLQAAVADPGLRSGGELGALVDLAGLADTIQVVMCTLTASIEHDLLAQRRAGLPLVDVLAMRTRLPATNRRALLATTAGLERMPHLHAAFAAGLIGAAELGIILGQARRVDTDGRTELDQLFADHALLARQGVDDLLDELYARVTQLADRKADNDRVKTYQRRFLAVQSGLQGTLAGYFEIDDTCGAMLLRALDDATVPLTGPNALTREATTPPTDIEPDPRTLGRRRADALLRLADHWLASHPHQTTHDQDSAASDSSGARPHSDAAGASGAGGEAVARRPAKPARPLVYVWTDIRHLVGDDASAKAARLLWDTLGPTPVLTPAALARISSDARLQFILADGSQILGVAAPTPTIPAKVRTAVQARDHHCRFPGCAIPARQTDLHHVTARTDGGHTTPGNLVCLCRRHHTAVTDARWKLTMTPNGIVTVRRGRHTATTDPPSHRHLGP